MTAGNNNNENNATSVKLTFDGQMRRFPFNGTSFAALREQVVELLGLEKTTDIVLKYTDEEGDLITISSDLELQSAMVGGQLLRVVASLATPAPVGGGHAFRAFPCGRGMGRWGRGGMCGRGGMVGWGRGGCDEDSKKEFKKLHKEGCEAHKEARKAFKEAHKEHRKMWKDLPKEQRKLLKHQMKHAGPPRFGHPAGCHSPFGPHHHGHFGGAMGPMGPHGGPFGRPHHGPWGGRPHHGHGPHHGPHHVPHHGHFGGAMGNSSSSEGEKESDKYEALVDVVMANEQLRNFGVKRHRVFRLLSRFGGDTEKVTALLTEKVNKKLGKRDRSDFVVV